jgi:hypothetical protein
MPAHRHVCNPPPHHHHQHHHYDWDTCWYAIWFLWLPVAFSLQYACATSVVASVWLAVHVLAVRLDTKNYVIGASYLIKAHPCRKNAPIEQQFYWPTRR